MVENKTYCIILSWLISSLCFLILGIAGIICVIYSNVTNNELATSSCIIGSVSSFMITLLYSITTVVVYDKQFGKHNKKKCVECLGNEPTCVFIIKITQNTIFYGGMFSMTILIVIGAFTNGYFIDYNSIYTFVMAFIYTMIIFVNICIVFIQNIKEKMKQTNIAHQSPTSLI